MFVNAKKKEIMHFVRKLNSTTLTVLFMCLVLTSLTGCNRSIDSDSGINSIEKPVTLNEITIDEAKNLIRTLFYDAQQAWNSGTQSGLDFTYSNNYPGAFDLNASAECAEERNLVSLGYVQFQTPDLNTVALDEEWVGPPSDDRDWLFSGIKPEGTTYIVTISFSSAYDATSVSETINYDGHVTILDGRAYFYGGFCLID